MIEGRSQFDENYDTFYPLSIFSNHPYLIFWWKKAKNLIYTTLVSQNKIKVIDK